MYRLEIVFFLCFLLNYSHAGHLCTSNQFRTENGCDFCHLSCKRCSGPKIEDCTSCYANHYRVGESLNSPTFSCNRECPDGEDIEILKKKYRFCKSIQSPKSLREPDKPIQQITTRHEEPPISNKIQDPSIFSSNKDAQLGNGLNLNILVFAIFAFCCILIVVTPFIFYIKYTREASTRTTQNIPLVETPEVESRVGNISMQQLDIKNKKKIGRGAFGTVYECTYTKADGETQKVAVKVLQTNNKERKKQMFEELENMTRIPRHPYVIKLLGVNMAADLILIMPRRQDNLYSYLARKTARLPKDQLTRFCAQIADGMLHLHSIPILHCDLKASNVLVKDEFTVQISDFGLSFHENDNNGRFRGGTITHLALELVVRSLEPRKVTKMTDVWAFGVTAWEIWTMARTKPYEIEGLTNQDQVAGYLCDGNRLTKPEYMPQELWNKVLQCFSTDPDVRPNFRQLHAKFARIMLASIASLENHLIPSH